MSFKNIFSLFCVYGSGGSILSSLISKGVRSTGIEALSLFEKSNSTGMCVNWPLYTSNAADELDGVDLVSSRINKKKKRKQIQGRARQDVVNKS